MNLVTLIGNLTREPELSYAPSTQTAICKFALAVRRSKDEQADFIRITVFGKQAESCDKYLKKGSKAAIEGRIQTGSYKDREGKTVYTTDVVASRVEFLGSPQKKEETVDAMPLIEEAFGGYDSFEQADVDIPF